MSSNWPYNVKHVLPGEPVQAGVVSRPDKTLQDRTDYLLQRLDAAEHGHTLFDTNAKLAGSVKVGQPVFWNYTAQRYELALAAVAFDDTLHTYVAQPSSDCVGICYSKSADTVGDILLYGIASIPELSNAIDGTITPGRYYLSAAAAGKLVKQRPSITVPVCYVQGATDECNPIPRVIVMPSTRGLIEEHTHYRFDLYSQPAGVHEVYTDSSDVDRHRINSADSDLPGWLPANNAVFNGKAPEGAVFGYNLSAHPAVQQAWPPVPVQAVSVIWDKGQQRRGGADVPMGPEGLVICDLNGIWWMSDCYGDVPWPQDWSGAPPEDTNQVSPPECSRYETMRVSIVFIRMLVGNDRGFVTSLKPGTDSPIVITKCINQEQADSAHPATGDLALNLALDYSLPNDVREPEDTVLEAGLVVTGKTPSGRQLQRGFVVAGLVAPQFTVTSTNHRNLTTEEKEQLEFDASDTVPVHQGIIKLSLESLTNNEVSPQIVRLNDTVERLWADIPYLGMPAGQASSMRLRLNVPDISFESALKMLIRVQLFGKGNSSTPMPALYMSYRRILKPGTTAGTAILLPTTETDSNSGGLTFNSAVAVAANTAVICDSSNFTVAAGDTILVTLSRLAGDTYPEVGVLRVAGILSAAS